MTQDHDIKAVLDSLRKELKELHAFTRRGFESMYRKNLELVNRTKELEEIIAKCYEERNRPVL